MFEKGDSQFMMTERLKTMSVGKSDPVVTPITENK
jgi:hypothetical protein